MMKLNLSDIRYNWVVIFIIQLLLSPGIDVFSQAMPVDTVYNQSYDWRPGQRETLPEWVFASQRKGRVVGISDPRMKSEAARMLALQRAAYLYSLQQGVQLRLLSDVFSTMETASNTYEDQRNKMLVLGVIEHPVQHVSYRIEHEYTSIFGEKFLEVSFTPSNDSCDFSYHSISELMLLFTKERVEEEEVKFNLLLESDSCREQSDQSWFQLKGTQSSPQIISYMNGVEICSSQEGCWYEDAGFGGQDGLEKMDMRNAFWNAYMSSLVKALLLYPFSDVNVKQVDDRFNGDTDSGCGLYREKVVAVLSIFPFIKDIRNNKLCVDWQITEQQNIIRK